MIIHFSLNCGPYRQLPGEDESEKRVKTAVYHHPMRAFLVALQSRLLLLRALSLRRHELLATQDATTHPNILIRQI